MIILKYIKIIRMMNMIVILGWTPSEYRVNHNSCIFTSILFMLFFKKIDKLKNNSILLNNEEELNNIINSDIKKITRENKLRKILSN
jgi:hypothetical protein